MRKMLKTLGVGLALTAIVGLLSVAISPGMRVRAQSLQDSIAWASTGKLVFSGTAPTVTSAGTSPSVTASNGSANFIVNVGTGGTATTIVMAMPTASTGWTCSVNDITASAAAVAGVGDRQSASSTTSVTVQHYTVSTGAVLAYTASDLVRFQCSAY